jgi:hypothetical protein
MDPSRSCCTTCLFNRSSYSDNLNFKFASQLLRSRPRRVIYRSSGTVRADDSSSPSTSGRPDSKGVREGIKSDATKLVGDTPMVCPLKWATMAGEVEDGRASDID